MSNNIVLVTGFGPFGDHKINASWEAVQLLPLYGTNNIDIVIEEIPVVYKIVDTKVPSLWKKYNPKLVVHVGVSSDARKITIERQAFRSGYYKTDCEGCGHLTSEACLLNEGKDCIETLLNVEEICKFINENSDTKACISTSAGRYLCEYIFYKSLLINPQRTLFIHVPPLNKPYTADELAKALWIVIERALEQLNSC